MANDLVDCLRRRSTWELVSPWPTWTCARASCADVACQERKPGHGHYRLRGYVSCRRWSRPWAHTPLVLTHSTPASLPSCLIAENLCVSQGRYRVGWSPTRSFQRFRFDRTRKNHSKTRDFRVSLISSDTPFNLCLLLCWYFPPVVPSMISFWCLQHTHRSDLHWSYQRYPSVA